MTREKKFRTFNEDSGKMTYFSLIDVPKSYSDKDITMEGTGLLDKRGKEIYEKDIIYYRSDSSRRTRKKDIRVVTWEKTRNGWNFTGARFIGGEMNWEIIGVFYKNPELLHLKRRVRKKYVRKEPTYRVPKIKKEIPEEIVKEEIVHLEEPKEKSVEISYKTILKEYVKRHPEERHTALLSKRRYHANYEKNKS